MDEDTIDIDFSDVMLPVHGVLAPEGVRTRDGRKFDPDSIWWNSLPLPLLFQEKTSAGHDASTVIGSIRRIERRSDGLLWWEGDLLEKEAAQMAVEQIADGASDGLSVDLFDVIAEVRDSEGNVVDEDYVMAEGANARDFEEVVVKGELGGATVVPFPAYREAFIALGPLDDEVREVEEVDQVELEQIAASATLDATLVGYIPDRAYAAAIMANEGIVAALTEEFVSIAPGKTEDGPGWLTHPIPTDRLRDYWVRGPGAPKIGWGTPGDFRRCRALLAPYVKPQYLSGYCANRHKDALGTWPGKHAGSHTAFSQETAEPYTLVASGSVPKLPPAEWFQDPKLAGPSPLTVTEDGRIFGHVATWDTCHISFPGKCVTPPRSGSDYAYFCTGAVRVQDGDQVRQVRAGKLTIGTGHADAKLGYVAAADHYDNTGTTTGLVEAGEDQYGIWVAGAVHPRATQEQIDDLRSSPLSGDWRTVGGSLEMVAALCVNVGGFPIPRSRETSDGIMALVAAGVVPRGFSSDEEFRSVLAEAVTEEMDRRESAREATARMEQLRSKLAKDRMNKIKERVR